MLANADGLLVGLFSSTRSLAVIHKFHDDNCQYLSLSLGEIVYIRRQCQGYPALSLWGISEMLCPNCRTRILVRAKCGTAHCILSATFCFQTRSLCGYQDFLDRSRTFTKVTFISSYISLRELDLPVLIRDEKYLAIDPYSEVLVDLHRKHLNLFNQLEDAKLISQCPAHNLFNVRLSFDRLPQAEITMYLVSQAITGASDFLPNTGGTSTAAMTTGYSADDQTGVGSTQYSNSAGGFQLASTLNRLTENVIVDGYSRVFSEVLFTLIINTHTHKRILLNIISIVNLFLATKDKIIGVAFLRLQPSASIPVLLSDGDYHLHVHKMDSHQIECCAYLRESSYLSSPSGSGSISGSQGSIGAVNIPSSSSSLSTFSQLKQRHETLHVRTRVCSNNHTTDENLTKVLFWRRYREDLIMCLRQGIYLSRKDVELRKFTASLIDSLVQILATCADVSQPHCSPNVNLGYSVLMALARCFQDLLNNQAYKNLVNAYLQAPSFDYPTVYYPYLRLLNSILSDILSSDAAGIGDAGDDQALMRPPQLRCGASLIDNKAIQMIFGRMHWAFRLIVRSRQLELERASEGNAACPVDSSPFVRQMDLFFSQVIKIISCSDNESLRSNLLKSVPEILKDISTVYPLERLASSVVTLIETTLECSGLRNHKILMETIQSPLFESSESRAILMPAVHRSMTTFFSDCLNKELVSGRVETDLRMDFWCDTLLTFVSRMVHTSGCVGTAATVAAEASQSTDADVTLRFDAPTGETSAEMFDLLVTKGFLRWTMQQLASAFLFIQNEELNSRSSGLSEDQWTARHKIPCHREHACTAGGGIGGSKMCPLNRAICAANRLQPILGHLTSSLFTLLQQLDRPSWIALLMPKSDTSETCDTPSCQCGVCARLQLIDLYDFCHEFLSLLSLMHEYPSYRSPSPCTQPSESHTRQCCTESRLHPMDTRSGGCDRMSHFEGAWIEMLLAISNAELQVLQLLTDLVIQPICISSASPTNQSTLTSISLRPDHPLTFELINMMQQCLGSFVVNQIHLCTESLPAVIRSRVDRSCRGPVMDMRQVACDHLASLWRSIGDQYKTLYVPAFLPTFIDMTTVPIASMRYTCVDLILEAMRFNPSCVERDLVSEIDRVMQWAGTGFAANLLNLFEDRWHAIASATGSSTPDSLSTRHQRLITDLIRHINCLLAYGEFFNHPSKLKEMLALHNLRAVYERNGRTDMVLRYLYRLENLHAEMGNAIERGYTLELISKQYSWSEEPVDRSHIPIRYDRYAAASSRALRERLLRDSLACLKKGTDWERAIDVCSELAELYRSVAPNFAELSSILSEQADLYQRIVSSQYPRIPYHYYLLVVNCPSFASFNGDRFVYRTTDDASEVLRTLSEQFPETTCLAKAPGVYPIPDHPTIFVSGNLIPQATLPNHLTVHEVDSRIKSYYLHNRVNCFTHIRHMKPTVTKDGREQPSAEETRYFVEDYLPNIVPLLPVTKTETSVLDPVQLANINIQDIIRRLEAHIALASEPSNLKGLEQMKGTLTSSIFSPVSGGLPKLLTPPELHLLFKFRITFSSNELPTLAPILNQSPCDSNFPVKPQYHRSTCRLNVYCCVHAVGHEDLQKWSCVSKMLLPPPPFVEYSYTKHFLALINFSTSLGRRTRP
ncbi:unnamed protein product [Dicrocoelium dendriticum]|nr:unnamed protein product [Dicrocoelium dendriticum]